MLPLYLAEIVAQLWNFNNWASCKLNTNDETKQGAVLEGEEDESKKDKSILCFIDKKFRDVGEIGETVSFWALCFLQRSAKEKKKKIGKKKNSNYLVETKDKVGAIERHRRKRQQRK